MNPEKNITANLRNSAIRSLVGPKGQFALSAEGVLTYHDNPEKSDHVTLRVTEEQITTEMERIQVEYDAQEYARDRAPAYPSVGDQLDMLMKDMRDGTTTHQTACEAVKAKYPKP